ncbi:hypothetical protein D3C75_955260 [compost metagenome]
MDQRLVGQTVQIQDSRAPLSAAAVPDEGLLHHQVAAKSQAFPEKSHGFIQLVCNLPLWV